MIAARLSPGAISESNSSHLPPSEASPVAKPVTFPLGRLSRATIPLATGSLTFAKTIGIVRVSPWTAAVAGVPYVTMMSGCRPKLAVHKVSGWHKEERIMSGLSKHTERAATGSDAMSRPNTATTRLEQQSFEKALDQTFTLWTTLYLSLAILLLLIRILGAILGL